MNERRFHLRDAFPEIPESCHTALMNAARSVKEEDPVKRTAFRTSLLAALVIIAVMAAAYAAFPSQVADFFGRLYGRDMQEWLERGTADTPQDSVTVGDVKFTLNEVIYRGYGLYGLVTIIGEGAENASVCVEKIGVDEGEMLMPVSPVGYASEIQPDGSVLHSFEISDGTAIGKGETFTMLLTATAKGEYRDWLVAIHPSPLQGRAEETAEDSPILAKDIGEAKLIVPDEYTQTGTMPVYKAIVRDFGVNLQPELFNKSGIAREEKYQIIFRDEARLEWSPETLFYHEYEGTYNLNYKNPEDTPAMGPHPSLSSSAYELAGNVRSGWPNNGESWKGIKLEKTKLSGITLEEAKAQVEALLAALNVEGYTCEWALDMDVTRIQSMGERMNQMIGENQWWNPPIVDYSQATAENEGFYLHYQNGVKTNENLFDISAYVTSKGIIGLHLRDMYARGAVHTIPEKLVGPEVILARLPVEVAQSCFSEMTVKSVISVELTYAPARAANSADGMVMTPAWYVRYYDTEDASYEAFAVFNATDGTLLNAMFL